LIGPVLSPEYFVRLPIFSKFSSVVGVAEEPNAETGRLRGRTDPLSLSPSLTVAHLSSPKPARKAAVLSLSEQNQIVGIDI
jgi:hypothetical protein